MAQRRGGFLRDNAFMVAAIALPVVVASLFILASAIPRWTVPPPAFDLLLKATRPYDQPSAALFVDFRVRDGRVEAMLRRPAPPNVYAQQWALLLYDHETMSVREVPLDLPTSMTEDEPPRTVAIEPLAGTRVSAESAAPDGYRLETRTSGSRGLVGDLFGMGRYRQGAVLANRGRVVEIDLPSPFGDPYQSPVYAVGWILSSGAP